MFWCSSGFPFLNWDIRTKTGQLLTTFSFDENDAVSTTICRTLDYSPMTAQVTFNNGSSINATVTVMMAINFNGSTITCNGANLILTVPTLRGKIMFTCTGIRGLAILKYFEDEPL